MAALSLNEIRLSVPVPMKPNLLYLAHRIPYPPNKGDKIRSYHMLQFLARHYRVYLGAFVDTAEDWQYAQEVARLCEGGSFLLPLHPKRARLKSLVSLFNPPLTLPYYRDARLQKWTQSIIEGQGVKRALAFSSAMAQYLLPYGKIKRVMDFVDVDSDKWAQYAKSQSWPMSWVYRREGKSLLAYEKKIAAVFDTSFFVSGMERNLFAELAPALADKLSYFNNGVDSDYFSPQQDFANPFPAETETIVFTGAMDYWANIDAVTWFAEAILPTIRGAQPNATFYIVGAKPSAAVMKLARLPGVKVVGRVPDTRPYLAHARLCVAPLRIARGVQNKVLEGMAMQKVVVTTPQAADGIEAKAGLELVVAADAASFAQRVIAQLGQPKPETGHAARQRVLANYNWDKNLQVLLNALES